MHIVKSNNSNKYKFTDEEETYIKQLGDRESKRLHHMLKKMEPNKEPRRLRVLRSNLPQSVKIDVFRQLAQNDTPKFEEWVEHLLRLPIGKYSTPPPLDKRAAFIKAAREKMDDEITGHMEAKHEVLRLICMWLNNGANNGFSIGLEGEPGVGKTSFVKRALSRGMDRPFCFIGLGGSSDASGLLGHGYTYEGSVPGRLAECLTRTQVMDPIIFFDELDKISTTGKGEELVHALIHLTDPVQNTHIRDRYLHGINLDFSRAVLVFSYNDASRVNPVLLDRIKRIRLNAPTTSERIQICQAHLVPKAMPSSDSDIIVSPDVLQFIIQRNSHEAGMRGIEKDISHVVTSYSLVKMYGSSDVLGLSTNTDDLDLAFAHAVLSDGQKNGTSHLMMYM
jgi:ATP-dependent Lon protease